MASESPFEGERDNAMAAATRLAEQHGMTVDEAARPTERLVAAEPARPEARPYGTTASEFSRFFDVGERNLKADKARREAAMRDAVDRGLDREAEQRRQRTRPRKAPQNASQRSPRSHAEVLLAETAFSLDEIVGLTGLDIYEVVGLKLKMRSMA